MSATVADDDDVGRHQQRCVHSSTFPVVVVVVVSQGEHLTPAGGGVDSRRRADGVVFDARRLRVPVQTPASDSGLAHQVGDVLDVQSSLWQHPGRQRRRTLRQVQHLKPRHVTS